MFLHRTMPAMAAAPIGHGHSSSLAGTPASSYGIWGLFVFAPFLQETLQAVPDRRVWAKVPILSSLFAGPPYGIGMLTAGLILAIMVLPFVTSISRDVFDAVPPVLKEAAYGLGCTTWEVVRFRRAPYTRVGGDRRASMLGPRPRARRDHGGDLRHRQRAPDFPPRCWRRAPTISATSPMNLPKRSATSTHRRLIALRPDPVFVIHLHRASRRPATCCSRINKRSGTHEAGHSLVLSFRGRPKAGNPESSTGFGICIWIPGSHASARAPGMTALRRAAS